MKHTYQTLIELCPTLTRPDMEHNPLPLDEFQSRAVDRMVRAHLENGCAINRKLENWQIAIEYLLTIKSPPKTKLKEVNNA